MNLIFVYVVGCIKSLFLLTAKQYFIGHTTFIGHNTFMWTCYRLFILLPVEGCLSRFGVLFLDSRDWNHSCPGCCHVSCGLFVNGCCIILVKVFSYLPPEAKCVT